MSKKILMIAGPNGAGKTTMTLELIRSCSMLYEFINADEALIIDNSSQAEASERVIARKNKGDQIKVLDTVAWKKIEEIAYEQ
jgi:predicted ABC-type ATPase